MNKSEVLIWGCLLVVLGLGAAAFILRPWDRSRTIMEAVVRNDAAFVRNWSGDVNMDIAGEHLLDVATGPKGGERGDRGCTGIVEERREPQWRRTRILAANECRFVGWCRISESAA